MTNILIEIYQLACLFFLLFLLSILIIITELNFPKLINLIVEYMFKISLYGTMFFIGLTIIGLIIKIIKLFI